MLDAALATFADARTLSIGGDDMDDCSARKYVGTSASCFRSYRSGLTHCIRSGPSRKRTLTPGNVWKVCGCYNNWSLKLSKTNL
jgi:hypothetical protein